MPFDDRVERRANIDDLRRAYLEDFLRESGSALASQINNRPMEELLVALEVANETDIGVEIRNIGLLMFCEYPQKFIPGAQVELIHFHSPSAEAGNFTEKLFTGPIQEQIRDALKYIRSMILEEKVVKVSGQAEALRFFNYPYDALEEALVNAVFHKSYLIPEPVEIRIYSEKIKIINYPGPDKWISMKKFRNGEAVSRRYRNRRIGEFLKEIDLSERKSTGITKILDALAKNGSPLPEFETDEEGRHYLETTIHIHVAFESDEPLDHTQMLADSLNIFSIPHSDLNDGSNGSNRGSNGFNDGSNRGSNSGSSGSNHLISGMDDEEMQLLSLIADNAGITYDGLAEKTGLKKRTVQRRIQELKQKGIIRRVGGTRGIWEIVNSWSAD
jgi:ATP-dependent DNA helicase RecG